MSKTVSSDIPEKMVKPKTLPRALAKVCFRKGRIEVEGVW
jgi:hypothetical protein